MIRSALALMLLTGCSTATIAPDVPVNESVNTVSEGRWVITLYAELRVALGDVEFFTDTCDAQGMAWVTEDSIESDPLTCSWREGEEELQVLGFFEPLPFADGAVYGDSFTMGWDGGLVSTDWLYGSFSGEESAQQASLTLSGWFEAERIGPEGVPGQ